MIYITVNQGDLEVELLPFEGPVEEAIADATKLFPDWSKLTIVRNHVQRSVVATFVCN